MANIGATTAFYKVETSLTRANSEVSKSMERLATGKANANAGDRSSYVAMADTFRLDFVGTKAGIKGASVTMGYLETGMRVLDSASSLLSRLQELAVLGANDTNTTADHEAINLEAEAIGDEFNRLMTTSTYKGRDVFNATAGSLYVSMGGRDQEMTFGIGAIDYSDMYNNSADRTIIAATSTFNGPNVGADFGLAHLPSDAVVAKAYGAADGAVIDGAGTLDAGSTYVVKAVGADSASETDYTTATEIAFIVADEAATINGTDVAAAPSAAGRGAAGIMGTLDVIVMENDATIAGGDAAAGDFHTFAKVNTGENAFAAGQEYVIRTMGDSVGNVSVDGSDAQAIKEAVTAFANRTEALEVGVSFTVDADASAEELARINALTEGMTFSLSTDALTKDIEAIQGMVNTARVQAGSQYAALESAVNYTTDLTAQYELGYNTVNDVNFSMETAHLAKNQILQQAATAMLAQANSGQQGLLQLIS
ncbi:MAG: flagellin [Paracoccaceae bacterium]